MKLFKRLSFHQKLLALPIASIFILSFLSITYIEFTLTQKSLWEHVTQSEMRLIEKLDETIYHLTDIHAGIHSVLIEAEQHRDEEKVYIKGKPLLEQLHKLQDKLKRLQNGFSPEKRLMINDSSGFLFFQELKEYKNILSDILNKTIVNYTGLAINAVEMSTVDSLLSREHMILADGYYAQAIKEFVSLTSKVRSHVQGEMQTSLNQTDIQLKWLIISSLIITMIWFMGSFLLARNISQNIRIISSNVSRLARGDREQPIPVFHNNREMAQIGQSLESFRLALKQLDIEVSERRKAEAELKLAFTVYDSTAEGILISDSQNRIIAVNPAFTRITGYEKDEVMGKNPSILQSEHHDKEFYDAMWQTLKETGRWQGEMWDRRKSGELWPNWMTISLVENAEMKEKNYICVMTDITELKESQEHAEFLAHHDPLTNLPNRILFNDRVEQALTRGERDMTKMALLFVDLDRFKTINDSLGHPVGDQLLKEVGRRLQNIVRAEDSVARLGGDEFVVMLEKIHSHNDAALIASKILTTLSEPVILLGREVIVTPSIGVSMFPEHGDKADILMRNADSAMYKAKEKGRDNYQFYTDEMTKSADVRLDLENDLRFALKKEQFEIYYQPQFELVNSEIVGVEALIRWHHPEQGMIAPDRFISLAEEIGIIESIGEWVLDTACDQVKKWQQQLSINLRIAVNLSARQLMHKELPETVRSILSRHKMLPELLELEVTESAVMERPELCIATINKIREQGVSIAVDDFGTGYSSLSYLKKLPINRVKIDKSFVSDIPDDQDDIAITRAIILMAKSLGIEVVAEGVENELQLEFLDEHQCEVVQGYYLGRPMPVKEFEQWYKNSQNNKF